MMRKTTQNGETDSLKKAVEHKMFSLIAISKVWTMGTGFTSGLKVLT